MKDHTPDTKMVCGAKDIQTWKVEMTLQNHYRKHAKLGSSKMDASKKYASCEKDNKQSKKQCVDVIYKRQRLMPIC
jgi:hypothetical protein